MDDILMETELNMQNAIETMEKRLLNIRAGRANPAILDSVMVNYYGAPTPLKQLATMVYNSNSNNKQNSKYVPPSAKNTTFSPSMNNTLEQMSKRY